MDDKTLIALELCFDKSPEEALAYLKSQGIAVTEAWTEALEKIKEHAFTVSRVAEADLLQTVHDELVKAMGDGGKAADYTSWAKNIQKTLEDRGWDLKDNYTAFRWDMIYRMNMQTAYQQGRFWEMEEADADFPYRQFIAIQDRRTTSGCNSLDSSIFRSTDPMYLTNQTPRHFNCRSTWKTLTKEQAGKNIKTGKDFPDLTPEPGFGLNPKEAKYKPDMKKYDQGIKSELEGALKK